MAAALSCVELAGPVVFDGFDSAGEAVGRPHPSPHVQLAAVSQDQAYNTMSLTLAMLGGGRAADEVDGLDLGLTRVRTDRGKLEPVTASAPSREGQRLTAAVLDEPHLWTFANHGVRLAATLRRNLGKTGGRSIETTNCWRPGEESVAEATAAFADLIAAGTLVGKLLRYHPKAVVADLADEQQLRAGLAALYADSPWIDIDRLVSEVYDVNTHPSDARRYYLNEVAVAEDSLIAAHEWDACETSERLQAGDMVTLGFDGGKSDDATALVAMRVHDRLLQTVGIWERPENAHGWEVDRAAVDDMVRMAFTTWNVVAFFADVEQWTSYIDTWSADFRDKLLVAASPSSPIGWDMRGRGQASTLGNERLAAAVRDGLVKQTGELRLRAHVLNARRRPNRYGVSFGKEARGSKRKVDGWAASLLADMARHEVVESGRLDRPEPKKRSGRVYGFG
ncbi:terminase [Nonomuraea deserti]|uniref:Terminase n=2 Tax=Nonomuraea deserti TaxID=1848322 RepID=A0A4R4V5J3_9ACTN|nr:terminase [Nonomuraea deserti]